MGIGGSDWATRIQCDFANQALTPKWTLIDNDCFKWSLDIIMNDEAIARAHTIGQNLARAAQKIADGTFQPLTASSARTTAAPRAYVPTAMATTSYLQEDGTAICSLRHRGCDEECRRQVCL